MGILDGWKFWDRTPTPDKKKSLGSGIYTPFYYNSATGELTGDFRPTNGSLQGSFKECPPIFTALDWKASKVAQCPLVVYNVQNKAKFYDYQQYRQEDNLRSLQKALKYKAGALIEVDSQKDPLKEFFNNPHPVFSLKELNYIYTISKAMTGSSMEAMLFVEDIFNNKKKVSRLAPLPTAMMTLTGGSLFNAPTKYLYTGIDDPNISREYDPQDILHIRNSFNLDYNNNYLYLGQSQLQAGSGLIAINKQAEQIKGQQFTNGGASGILTEDSADYQYDDNGTGEIDALQQRIDAKILGQHNLNKIVYFPRPMKFNQIGGTLADMGVLESDKANTRALCAMLGIDPVVLGINTESGMGNGGNYDQGLLKSYNDGVLPELSARQEEFNKKVCPRFGDNYFVEFDTMSYSHIAKQRMEQAIQLSDKELISKNEARELMGYGADPNELSNQIWVSTSKQPISEYMINSISKQTETVKNDGSYD